MEEAAIATNAALTAASLTSHLRECQYHGTLLANEYDFGSGRVPVAGFAHAPHDARSICIGAIDTNGDSADAVTRLKPLGAPVVFACSAGKLQWWKQTPGEPQLMEVIEAREVPSFFAEHSRDFAPSTIFEGKTRRRLPGQVQLEFVDAGLLPLLEKESGEALSRLVDVVISDIEQVLGKEIRTKKDVEAAFKSVFWLLAAKILHDKQVPNFKRIELSDIDNVFSRVGRHYGETEGLPPSGGAWRRAIEQAAVSFDQYPSLAHVSTESLAHLYENTLIPATVRKELATHSTPSALVDYMVWQLAPWIEEIPEDRRHVFEPACGHGAFLVAAMRMLRQWSSIGEEDKRHAYLRSHLHGIEIDGFAVEIARLSLTLADIPHGNSWDLVQGNMFAGSMLEERASSCGVLLANPPFTKLSQDERRKSREAGATEQVLSKPVEMLRRTIPCMRPGACFGVVVPHGFLHNKEGLALRRTMLRDFEFFEIDVFADSLFEKAAHEVGVLLGRRRTESEASRTVWFRRVREADVEAFRDRFEFSTEDQVDATRFAGSKGVELRVPELDAVWRHLNSGPRLDEIATISQGLFYKGKTSLPPNGWTIHDPPHEGDALGYANVQDARTIYSTPKRVGLNLDRNVIDRWVAGAPTGKPQVLLNYAPVSRRAWKLRAALDEEGLALTNRFSAVRPSSEAISVICLWALLNSPVANAFAYCHLGKRDILIGTMGKMPVPPGLATEASSIEQAASFYRELASSPGPLFDTGTEAGSVKRALLKMDAAVLRAYNLPPKLERQLLDLFAGVERKGVGCDFRGYYPPGFTSHLPLHVLVSDQFERASADDVSNRFSAESSPYVRAVLATAATALDSE